MRRLTGALVMVLALLAAPGVASAQHELSTSDHLKSRRYVAAGDRAYVMGFEDGRFYAQGWHITGEMGGVWSQPLKLVDGVWFGVDDQWVGPATKFTSGWGYTRMDLPDIDGLKLTRIDFAPDGHRAALIGLRIDNPEAARQVSVKVDARSEVMAQYPWGWTTPGAGDFNAADTGAYTGGALQFRNTGTQSSGAHAPEEEHLLSGAASRQLATPAGRSSRGRGPGSRAAVDAPGRGPQRDPGAAGNRGRRGRPGPAAPTAGGGGSAQVAGGQTHSWAAAAIDDRSFKDARKRWRPWSIRTGRGQPAGGLVCLIGTAMCGE